MEDECESCTITEELTENLLVPDVGLGRRASGAAGGQGTTGTNIISNKLNPPIFRAN